MEHRHANAPHAPETSGLGRSCEQQELDVPDWLSCATPHAAAFGTMHRPQESPVALPEDDRKLSRG